MLVKIFSFFVVGLVPCVLFGYAVVRRFERLLAPQIVTRLRTRKSATLFWVLCGTAWPVGTFYLAFDNPSDFHVEEGLLGLMLGLLAMMAGALLRKTERKEEEEKYLYGEGTGY